MHNCQKYYDKPGEGKKKMEKKDEKKTTAYVHQRCGTNILCCLRREDMRECERVRKRERYQAYMTSE